METIKKLLKKGPVVVPGIYDAMSGLIVQKVGFQCCYLSGAALSSSLLGKPDIGLLTLDEVVRHVERISQVLRIPILVDADTGFGGAVNVMRTVQTLEAAGASGIQIEDQKFPKRCGHLKGKTLIPIDEMVRKIKLAIKARKNKNLAIIARTDARGVTTLKDALKRAQAYKRAGADIIFPEALTNRAEFEAFGAKKSLGPLLANMTEFGVSPLLGVEQLAHLGFQMVLYPVTALRVGAMAMEMALKKIKNRGSNRGLTGQMQTRKELYALNRYADFDKIEREM